MKKYLKAVSILLILSCFLLILSACGTTLNGKYVAKGLLSQSFTSESNGKATTSAAGLDLVSGTYKIENGKITFSFNTDGILEIAGNSLGLNHSMTFEKKGNSIFLDGTEYVKG